MFVLTSNQTNKHFTIHAFLFIPPSRVEERIYIGQGSTVTKDKLLWENIWKYMNNPIEIQSEVLSQCESCIIYNLSLMIFALLSFQIASSLSPILKVFTSSSLVLFGRFSVSFNIKFKVTTSWFKLNKYIIITKRIPQLCSNSCFIALEKKVERVNRLWLVC